MLLLSPLASLYIVEKLVRNFLEGAAQKEQRKAICVIISVRSVRFSGLADPKCKQQRERESMKERRREGAQCRELVGRDCLEMKCEVRRAEPARRFAKTDYRNTSKMKIYVRVCVCVCVKNELNRGRRQLERGREDKL